MTRVRQDQQGTIWVDLFLLFVTAPLLYLPHRFGPVAAGVALGVLVAGSIWRRWRIGVWRRSTPADWPLLLLTFVMLPLAVWVAPDLLRTQYAWPRALALLWDLQLFVVIVTYVSCFPRLLTPAVVLFTGFALFFALLAPFGTNWLFKLPGSEALLSRLPAVLSALSREGGSGFHPNVIAGGLLYALPLLIALTVAGLRQGRWHGRARWVQWLLLAATLYMTIIFALLQSRSGYLGLLVALLVMPALRGSWGRRLLALGIICALLLVAFQGRALLEVVADNPGVQAVGGVATLSNFRFDLWRNALRVIHDYPFTGVGLGAFQDVALSFYLTGVPSTFYFGHAHNFWLQIAIDFGIPGLVAMAAICLAAAAQLRSVWRARRDWGLPGLVTGLTGSLVAQLVFSLTDSLSLGTTVNLLFWFLLALVFALGNLVAPAGESNGSDPPANPA